MIGLTNPFRECELAFSPQELNRLTRGCFRKVRCARVAPLTPPGALGSSLNPITGADRCSSSLSLVFPIDPTYVVSLKV